MCSKCSNTGVIHKEIYPGMVTVNGCNCEVAKQQEVSYAERRKAFEKRLQVWERRLLHEQRVV
ncbi:hypothetical protein [Bacillus cereus]|uniref:hypothetical protein n=1 Tax=Bacillus cereus TaxID=1396 RepID=UPI00397F7208